jgi:hypothetical protein
MLDFSKVENMIIKALQTELIGQGHKATGELISTMEGRTMQLPDSLVIEILMQDYSKYVNAANEITGITEKTSVDNQDEFIIEDSEASYVKKSITRKNIVKPIVNSVETATTLTPNIDENEQEDVTDLASALTIAAPTGTPSTGMKLVIRLTDNGTNRALTWNGIYKAIGVTLPTTTTANKILYIGCIYDEAGSKWDVVAIKEEV